MSECSISDYFLIMLEKGEKSYGRREPLSIIPFRLLSFPIHLSERMTLLSIRQTRNTAVYWNFPTRERVYSCTHFRRRSVHGRSMGVVLLSLRQLVRVILASQQKGPPRFILHSGSRESPFFVPLLFWLHPNGAVQADRFPIEHNILDNA